MSTSSRAASTKALAEKLNADSVALEKSNSTMSKVYIGVAVALLLYAAWAYMRITTVIEPATLGDSVGEIAVGRALEIIESQEKDVSGMAPQLVHDAEDAVLKAFPGFREQLETSLKQQLADSITPALKMSDIAMIEEISKLSGADKLVRAAAQNEGKAQELFEKVRKTAEASARTKKESVDSVATLKEVREHLQKLQANKGLSAADQSERKLIQVVLTQMPLPSEITPADLKTGKAAPGKSAAKPAPAAKPKK